MFQLLVGNKKATREERSRVADFNMFYSKVLFYIFGFFTQYYSSGGK